LIFCITLEADRSAVIVECIMPEGCTKSLYGSMRMIAVLGVLELREDMMIEVECMF
jgi:hypothetical protein